MYAHKRAGHQASKGDLLFASLCDEGLNVMRAYTIGGGAVTAIQSAQSAEAMTAQLWEFVCRCPLL